MPCKMEAKKTSCWKPQAKPKYPSTSKRQSMHASWKRMHAKHACMRKRLESNLPKDHKDHIAEKGLNSISHNKLVRKFIPMPQAMKTPDAKAAVDKELKKLETTPAWQLNKVKSKRRSFWNHNERKRKSTLLH